jgi:protein SCO1/2
MRYLTLPAVCWLLVSCASPTPDGHGTPYEPAALAGDFTLDDQFGSPFQLQSQAGKATLLFFGYTNCPDVCPTTVADMKWVFHQLGERAEGLTFAFVTIDPARDTPQVLRDYLARFNPGFLGLTGDPALLEQIRSEYGIFAEIDPAAHAEHYLMTHTARVFLIDPQGLLQTSYSYGTPRQEILLDLQALLRGG